MVYNYICTKNKDHTAIIENPINDPLPEVQCEICKTKMVQDYKGKFNANSIIVPFGFRAVGQEMYKYQKSYGKFNAHEKQLY